MLEFGYAHADTPDTQTALVAKFDKSGVERMSFTEYESIMADTAEQLFELLKQYICHSGSTQQQTVAEEAQSLLQP